MAEEKEVSIGESEETAGKAEKAPKSPKTPKAPKTSKSAAPAKPPAKKKKKKRGKLFIILIIIVLLIGGIGAFVYALLKIENFPPRDAILNWAYKLDPRYESFEMRLDELELREAELDKRERSLDSKQNSLDGREASIVVKEEELAEREQNLTPLYRQPLSEQDLEDMESLGKIYSSMNPENAANILAELYDNEDIAAILYYMTERYAAGILAAMDPDYAAVITEILLRK